jgi:transcriptional regulator with XRE-family HTH domain
VKDIYGIVGARIRQERKARAMTLEQLASLAAMNTSFLHAVETSRKKLSLNTAQRIADALRIPVTSLFADVPVGGKTTDIVVGKTAAIMRDANPRKKRTILKVVETMIRER